MSADVEVIDSLVASSGRLRILTTLAAERRCEFVRLRRLTRLTDGNLATHTRRLETAGLVAVEKSFRDRKPITHMSLTVDGRQALERHARDLMAALGMMQKAEGQATLVVAQATLSREDDWVD